MSRNQRGGPPVGGNGRRKSQDVNISGRNSVATSVEHVARDSARSIGNFVDAAGDLVSGNPERALRNLSKAATQSQAAQSEMLYAASFCRDLLRSSETRAS